ncbi:MAG: MATE family efflux transporter [Myxococcales bacterium]|nr:MATE family efflux transporter [Myxococcales bacterium]
MATLAWPLAVGLLSFTVMGVVDTLLMGQVSTGAQAGVGLATVLTFGALAFFRGVVTGAQSLVAAAHGANNADRVTRAGSAGLLLGAVTGVLAAGVLAGLTAWVLPRVVTDAAIAGPAADYLWVRVFSLPFSLVAFGLMGALQGLGDTRSRARISVVGNGLNVGFDLLLIFGWGPFPRLEATGAGLATLISTVAMCALFALRFRRLFGRPVAPGWPVLRDSLTIGLPAGVSALLSNSAFVVIGLVLAHVGAADLAAHEVVLNIVSVSFLPGHGIGEASGVLVGRYVGAGRPRTAMRALRSGRGLAVAVMGGFGLLFLLTGDALAGAFSADPEVARIGGTLLLFAAAFQLFDAVVMVHLSVLRGVGDTRWTMGVTTLCAWGITVPSTLALAGWLELGAPGAWAGLTGEFALLAFLTARRVAGIGDGTVGRADLLLGEGT